MSRHQEWKMIHLLFNYARRQDGDDCIGLTAQELTAAGVHCELDTRLLLEDAGVVRRSGSVFELTEPARKIVATFTVAKGPPNNVDIRVDYPEAFVVMAFGQPWSDAVHTQMFAPAIEDAGFAVARGDSVVRVGDLGTNVWRAITQAGVIVAEVSVPNPNVYYELGLADALGKPVFLFKQADAALPADIGGVHYYEYRLTDLAAGRRQLADALRDWAAQKDNRFFGVKALADR